MLGRALIRCSHGHHLRGSFSLLAWAPPPRFRHGHAQFRGYCARRFGEVYIPLFSQSPATWEDGVSIRVPLLIFLALDLLTGLKYDAAQARAEMPTVGKGTIGTER